MRPETLTILCALAALAGAALFSLLILAGVLAGSPGA